MFSTTAIRTICDAIDEHGYVPPDVEERIIDESGTGAPKAMGRAISAIEAQIFPARS